MAALYSWKEAEGSDTDIVFVRREKDTSGLRDNVLTRGESPMGSMMGQCDCGGRGVGVRVLEDGQCPSPPIRT